MPRDPGNALKHFIVGFRVQSTASLQGDNFQLVDRVDADHDRSPLRPIADSVGTVLPSRRSILLLATLQSHITFPAFWMLRSKDSAAVELLPSHFGDGTAIVNVADCPTRMTSDHPVHKPDGLSCANRYSAHPAEELKRLSKIQHDSRESDDLPIETRARRVN